MNTNTFLIFVAFYFVFTNCLLPIDKLFEFEVNIFDKHILHEIKERLVFGNAIVSKETKKNGDIVFRFWKEFDGSWDCIHPFEMTLSKVEIKKIICFDEANMFLCYLPLITIEFNEPQTMTSFTVDKAKIKKGLKFEKGAFYALFISPYDPITGNYLGVGKKHFRNVENNRKFCF